MNLPGEYETSHFSAMPIALQLNYAELLTIAGICKSLFKLGIDLSTPEGKLVEQLYRKVVNVGDAFVHSQHAKGM